VGSFVYIKFMQIPLLYPMDVHRENILFDFVLSAKHQSNKLYNQNKLTA